MRVGKTNAHRHRHSLNTKHSSRDQSHGDGQAGQAREEGAGGARPAAVTPVLRVAEIRAAEAGGDGAVIVVTHVKNNSLRQS